MLLQRSADEVVADNFKRKDYPNDDEAILWLENTAVTSGV